MQISGGLCRRGSTARGSSQRRSETMRPDCTLKGAREDQAQYGDTSDTNFVGNPGTKGNRRNCSRRSI
jgi:hypothetical protein